MTVTPAQQIKTIQQIHIFYNANDIFAASRCPGGEIGRRTILRGWRWQRRGSSNLLLGTSIPKASVRIEALFFISSP